MIGIVGCSNAQPTSNQEKITELLWTLRDIGLIPQCSDFLYEKEDVFSGTVAQRAKAIMDFYRDPDVKAIFDISGGDVANQLLPYLDYTVIQNSHKTFYGYSDVTTIVNAIYCKTQEPCGLYQIRNLETTDHKKQIADFVATIMHGETNLTDISYHYLRGSRMQGVVIGGNIRCFLKLAGTPYLPDATGKVLLLEAFSSNIAQVTTYFSQLQQMGILHKVNGVLLGTFSALDSRKGTEEVEKIALQMIPEHIPVARTYEVGHGSDSKCVMIGAQLPLSSNLEM